MKLKRTMLAAVAAGAAAVALVATSATAGAAASNPTFVTYNGFGHATSSAAFDLAASGALLNVSPTGVSTCAGGLSGHNSAHSGIAALNTTLATVNALDTKCTAPITFGAGTSSESTIANVSLLGGLVQVTALDSKCSVNLFGQATIGSTEAAVVVNANYTRNGTGAIVIPGVATIAEDVNSLSAAGAATIGLYVTILPVVVAGHVVTSGQTLEIGGCSIGRPIVLT